MAKTKTDAGKSKPKKKAKSAGKGSGVTIKGKARKSKSGKAQNGFDALAKLAEHPIVSDLIAIGATAAVAAIASGMSSKSGKSSGKAVKDAGKAAAAAIGARLMSEFKAVKDSAAEAKAKESKAKGAAGVALGLQFKRSRIDRRAAFGLDRHPRARREPVGGRHRGNHRAARALGIRRIGKD